MDWTTALPIIAIIVLLWAILLQLERINETLRRGGPR